MTYIQETNTIQGNQHILIGVFSWVTGEEIKNLDPLIFGVTGGEKITKRCGEKTVSTRVTHVREWIDSILNNEGIFCVHGITANVP